MSIFYLGIDLAGILRGTHGERWSWVGAEWGGVWWGVSPLQPTRGSEGASWAPQVGSGAEPWPKTDFGVFWRPQNVPFCIYMTKIAGGTICTSVPCSKFWGGDLSPASPVIYARDFLRWTMRPVNWCSFWFVIRVRYNVCMQGRIISLCDQQLWFVLLWLTNTQTDSFWPVILLARQAELEMMSV